MHKCNTYLNLKFRFELIENIFQVIPTNVKIHADAIVIIGVY